MRGEIFVLGYGTTCVAYLELAGVHFMITGVGTIPERTTILAGSSLEFDVLTRFGTSSLWKDNQRTTSFPLRFLHYRSMCLHYH